MGALSEALERAARDAGATIRTGAEVTRDRHRRGKTRRSAAPTARRYACAHVLAGVAPAVLAAAPGRAPPDAAPEGSQLKLNMLLTRLPRLRDPAVAPEQAFAGTFHVNEGYEQLQRAYEQAARRRDPDACRPASSTATRSPTRASSRPSCSAAGHHTLTLFGLHMPARLFAGRSEAPSARRSRRRSSRSTACWPSRSRTAWPRTRDGAPCLEAHTPLDLEAELAMPGGHIFHRDLAWPFAESDEEVGPLGRRDGLPERVAVRRRRPPGRRRQRHPGHNAARAVLAASASAVGEEVRVDLRVVAATRRAAGPRRSRHRPGRPRRRRRSRCTPQGRCRASRRCRSPARPGVGWMQSTGQTSTHELSFVPMQGSAIT